MNESKDRAALRAWIDWMDSAGDGTDKSVDDEEAMLEDMRVALAQPDPVPALVSALSMLIERIESLGSNAFVHELPIARAALKVAGAA